MTPYHNQYMPVSRKNIDRHGLKNLEVEKVKPLDRLQIPVVFLYFFVFVIISYMAVAYAQNRQDGYENLMRKALIKK